MQRSLVVLVALAAGCGESGLIGTPTRTVEPSIGGTDAPPPSLPIDDPNDPVDPVDDPEPPVDDPPDDPGPPPEPEFSCAPDELPSLISGATKVKTLLTGLPLTDDEIATLQGPTDLEALVQDWLETDTARAKVYGFLRTALQQDALDVDGFSAMFDEGRVRLGAFEDDLLTNLGESVARTALRFAFDGTPFHRIYTTDTFMMTTAMMVTFAYWDARLVDDAGDVTYRGQPPIPSVTVHQDRDIPRGDSFDPAHPDFLHFSVPEMANRCPNQPTVVQERKPELLAFKLMFGRADGNQCFGSNTQAALTENDFDDWRMVRIRAPEGEESVDSWLDYQAMRTKNVLRVGTPRVGYFSSPAFLGLWLTNDSNSHRVTTNQALIVGLGRSFEEDGAIIPAFEDALDDEHAVPGTTCYGCHSSLDPMRQFFRQSLSIWNNEQTDPSVIDIPAEFTFAGVSEVGSGIGDFGDILSRHPEMPKAWLEKLCYFANGEACPTRSAAFEAVLEDFTEADYDFTVLLNRALSSPLVTGTECIEGGSGPLASISRARHLCTTLAQRLEFPQACSFNRNVRDLVSSIPDDTYARASVSPITIREDDIFIRSAEEKICYELARNRIGQDAFPINDPPLTLSRLVEQLMGYALTHPQHDTMLGVMNDHFTTAEARAKELGAGNYAARREALRSAFMVACQSPSVVGMGL
jgi:hypothetical protein